MSNEELDILRQGESETVEFKESFRDDALETISAFANTRGGTLVIGVNDHIRIWSPGLLPYGLTVDDLRRRSHASKPRNKLIAQVFYDLEIIERYGSGIYRMLDACAAAGLPEPELEESTGGFRMTFHKVADVGRGVGEQVSEQVSEQVDEQVGEQVVRMLNACRKEPLPKKELLKAAGFANAYLNYKRHVAPLLTSGLIEMTLPDNPRSSNQKYRLTEHGRAVLATVQKKVDNET